MYIYNYTATDREQNCVAPHASLYVNVSILYTYSIQYTIHTHTCTLYIHIYYILYSIHIHYSKVSPLMPPCFAQSLRLGDVSLADHRRHHLHHRHRRHHLHHCHRRHQCRSSLSPLKKYYSFAPQRDLFTPWYLPETDVFDDDNYDSGAVDDVAVVDDDAVDDANVDDEDEQ